MHRIARDIKIMSNRCQFGYKENARKRTGTPVNAQECTINNIMSDKFHHKIPIKALTSMHLRSIIVVVVVVFLDIN